jgi:hypothetical protein
MGLIPKKGDAKESIGVIPVVVVHLLLGLGIMLIGQRTKNVAEFWAGLAFFLFIIAAAFVSAFLHYQIYASGPSLDSLFNIFRSLAAILSWIYILLRLFLLDRNKEVKVTLI